MYLYRFCLYNLKYNKLSVRILTNIFMLLTLFWITLTSLDVRVIYQLVLEVEALNI